MYGDTGVMRRRAAQLREQGDRVRTLADRARRPDRGASTGPVGRPTRCASGSASAPPTCATAAAAHETRRRLPRDATCARWTGSRTSSPRSSARPPRYVADARTAGRVEATTTSAAYAAPRGRPRPRRLHPAACRSQGLADHRLRTDMPTIDLSTPPPPPTGLLDALPRRVALTLPELRLVAERAGGAPLPFDVVDARRPDAPRTAGLGRAPAPRRGRGVRRRAGLAARPGRATLTRRGLLADDAVDEAGLLGAVGLLATPAVAARHRRHRRPEIRASSWHRQAGGAVATLSTVDGIVFELAWFPTRRSGPPSSAGSP